MFSKLYVSMVRAGELGGILDEVLNRLADAAREGRQIRRAVKSAMVYPIIIGSFAIIVLIGMVMFLIPIFAGMYKDLGNAKLPMLTRIMMSVSEHLPQLVGSASSWRSSSPSSGASGVSSAPSAVARSGTASSCASPWASAQIVRKLAVARFSRTLGTLITSGVPILQAIEITGQAAGNAVIEKAMVDVQKSVKEGQSITAPLAKEAIFPPMVTQMISVGEETGSLDAMLNKIADFYEDEVNASVKSLTSILEPILMLGVGALVGIVVISHVPADLQHDEHRQVGRGRAWTTSSSW